MEPSDTSAYICLDVHISPFFETLNFFNVLHCPCIMLLFIRIQPNTLISFHIFLFTLLIFSMFRRLLSHHQRDNFVFERRELIF
jgi:hypothetical protein